MVSCPKCEGENVQRLSVLHEAGIASSSSQTAGGGIGVMGGTLGGGAFGAISQGVHQSALSKRFAPPQTSKSQPSLGVFVVGAMCALLAIKSLAGVFIGQGSFGGGFAFSAVAGVCAWIFLRQRDQAAQSEERAAAATQAYNDSYFCHRCGEVFIPQPTPAA